MYIFSNLAISLDGKIATPNRKHLPLGTPLDRKQMHVLRRKTDAILMGATSLRAFRRFCRADGKKGSQPANIILSSRLEGISPRWPFFQDASVRRILFVTSVVTPARARQFEKTSELVTLRPPRKGSGKDPIALQVVRELEMRGISRLLVEGGGGVMWDFVEQDLIDEFHVTLTPWIIGGKDSPTLVDGAGFTSGDLLKLQLAGVRRVRDELYLVYRRRRGNLQRKR
ncbi:MAG: hypothetical protein A2X94_09885 [Bdellovibrionales bacterium GWB1_55_8]|nr:MAG: hypothetical protein A2X94_09885 [Bdellovibrionales bacterium GWB1_55_8]